MTVRTDDFNRANQNPLAGNWTCEIGPGSPPLPATWENSQILNQKVWGTSAGHSCPAWWNADTFGANQFSQAKIYGLANPGVMCRCVAGAGTAYFYMYPDRNTATLYRFVGGSDFQLIYSVPTTYADGDTIRLEVTGTGATVTLRLYKNSILIGSFDDTAAQRITTAGKLGIHSDGNGEAEAGIDDWTGGDLSTGECSSMSLLGVGRCLSLPLMGLEWLRGRKNRIPRVLGKGLISRIRNWFV